MVKGRNTNRRKERAKLDRNMQVTEKERERVAEEIKTETKRKKVREK